VEKPTTGTGEGGRYIIIRKLYPQTGYILLLLLLQYVNIHSIFPLLSLLLDIFYLFTFNFPFMFPYTSPQMTLADIPSLHRLLHGGFEHYGTETVGGDGWGGVASREEKSYRCLTDDLRTICSPNKIGWKSFSLT
jgi:hypothetical protein